MQHKKKSLFKKSGSAGFTMLEMLTVLAIFGIVSAVVLFNHGKFTSETILTNMAYEVALSIREAQIYGVSVRGGTTGGANFDAPYGIHIPAISEDSELNEYVLFRDSNGDNTFMGNCPGDEECVTPYTFQRNIFIVNTAIEVGNEGNCPLGHQDSGLNIIFNRPNPEPVITTNGSIGAPVTRAQITLKSRDNAFRYVVISNNGQISVENKSICGSQP